MTQWHVAGAALEWQAHGWLLSSLWKDFLQGKIAPLKIK